MSTSQSTVDYILDQTNAAGTMSARKMFGEYGLYCNGKLVGQVCDDTLFLKITSQGKEYAGSHYAEGIPYQGAKPAMLIEDSLLEDGAWLSELVAITEKNLPTPKPKSPKKKRT
ncbi:MAG: competence protein TfoX [Anaerolineaceae bacterium]|nr:competence protein TfoX [Anaerolineaceae bacterium]